MFLIIMERSSNIWLSLLCGIYLLTESIYKDGAHFKGRVMEFSCSGMFRSQIIGSRAAWCEDDTEVCRLPPPLPEGSESLHSVPATGQRAISSIGCIAAVWSWPQCFLEGFWCEQGRQGCGKWTQKDEEGLVHVRGQKEGLIPGRKQLQQTCKDEGRCDVWQPSRKTGWREQEADMTNGSFWAVPSNHDCFMCRAQQIPSSDFLNGDIQITGSIS